MKPKGRERMKTLQLQITLLSHTLIGSGEGFGTVIDTDVVFDDVGIPFIPAKRVKGCLKDSAEDVKKMFNDSGIEGSLNMLGTFGEIGKEFDEHGEKICQATYSNLTIVEYEANKQWLKYLSDKATYGNVLSKETIMNTFTTIRQQTAIDENGVAKAHSLRTIRVVKKGYTFYGDIQIDSDEKKIVEIVETLALACLNLRRIGTKRNRGFGEVACKLFDTQNNTDVIPSMMKKLEGLCKDSSIG
jgi:CRISPR/Cas system CSM-associated protein Csm3 (group 7 of RAMP superfamily)